MKRRLPITPLLVALVAAASLGCRRPRRVARPSGRAPSARSVDAGTTGQPDCAAARPAAPACTLRALDREACARAPEVGCAIADGEAAPAGLAILHGVLQEADVDPPRPFAGATLRVFAPSAARATELRVGADGAYRVLVPIGAPVFYASAADGFLGELHALTATRDGARMELQLRHAAFFERVLSLAGRRFDPTKALVAVELLGAPEGGVGARVIPRGDAPFVLTAPGAGEMRAIDGERLVAGGHHLVLYPNVPPGELEVALLDAPGLVCQLASAPPRWPARAGVVTQIDATCAPRR